jgi:hypothetical protein
MRTVVCKSFEIALSLVTDGADLGDDSAAKIEKSVHQCAWLRCVMLCVFFCVLPGV